jgi:1,2-diacylglycerol 3-beta-glucosyltransferase
MTLLLVGLALLVAWPMYNLALVLYSARDETNTGRHRDGGRSAPADHEPTVFWIVVPCLNEERVVGQTVRNALGLRGPVGTRTRVLVVDDGSDDNTPNVLAAIDDENLRVLRRNLPDARRGKGEALNAAYRYIREQTALELLDPARVAVGVIDGDGRGSRNMLVEVARAMRDPQVGAVQCRVRIHNRDKLLAAMQDLEFACIANASQLMRNSLGTVGLGGNGQYARLSALRLLGDAPWSACLVEDLELGIRMHLAEVKIRYTSRATVTQQGLTNVRRLLRQRTRWAQGNLQCVRYVPTLYKATTIPNSALVEMLYYLLAPWFNAVGTVAMSTIGAYTVGRLLLAGTSVSAYGAATVAVWLLAMLAPFVLWGVLHRMQLRDEKLTRLMLAGLCYPAFLFLGLLSTYRAIGRQVAGRSSWAKTERLAEDGETPAIAAAIANRAVITAPTPVEAPAAADATAPVAAPALVETPPVPAIGSTPVTIENPKARKDDDPPRVSAARLAQVIGASA